MSRATSTVRHWLLATRPATLPVSLAPVAVGCACAVAAGGFAPLPAAAAALGALLLQIGANFANDLFDQKRGADDDSRVGPPRAVHMGWISPTAMLTATVLAFACAFAVGVYLVVVGGWPIAVLGIAAIMAGFLYTGGPFPLGYNALGDVAVFFFFGYAAVCGTVYVQVGRITELAVWCSLPLACLATAVLVVNNVRDRSGDARVNKRTLVVVLGERFGRLQYSALVGLAMAVPIALLLADATGVAILLPLITAPMALHTARLVWTRSGAPLNAALAATARLMLIFAALFAVGIVWGTAF